MKISKKILFIPILVIPSVFFLPKGQKPKDLGVDVKTNQFSPCLKTSKCLSSFSPKSQQNQHIDPIEYKIDSIEAYKRISRILAKNKNYAVRAQTSNYIYATYKHSFTGFVQDVEFYFPKNENKIHLKSRNRSQFNFQNIRSSLETIRFQFNQFVR